MRGVELSGQRRVLLVRQHLERRPVLDFDRHVDRVRFEDLVAGEQSTASASKARALDSWNAALTFVGEAPLRSYAELERAFWAAGVTDTSPGTQCDALQDPDGVSAALRGTRFEALLTC